MSFSLSESWFIYRSKIVVYYLETARAMRFVEESLLFVKYYLFIFFFDKNLINNSVFLVFKKEENR
jgi:hypothetical protein